MIERGNHLNSIFRSKRKNETDQYVDQKRSDMPKMDSSRYIDRRLYSSCRVLVIATATAGSFSPI